MVNAYSGNSYKLTFPLLSKGYLKLNFRDHNIDHSIISTVASGYSSGSTSLEISGGNASSFPSIGTGTIDGVPFSWTAKNNLTLIVSDLGANYAAGLTITSDTTLLTNIWKHSDSFTLEAIITPYDVNGSANRLTGHGILTSSKTPPYLNDAVTSNRHHYESVDALGDTEFLTQKMMIFHNTNLKIYLQNTTITNFNQPAEYKIVVEITKNGVTKTIASNTVITSTNVLHGKYDELGYYTNGLNSEYTRLSTTASNSSPSAVVTISGNGLPVNSSTNAAAATATLTCNNHSTTTPASSAVSATATIDIGGAGSDFTVPADANVAAATGSITVLSVVGNSTSSSSNQEINIYNSGTASTDLIRFYPRTTGNNGAALPSSSFPSRSFGFLSEGSVENCAANLSIAINTVNTLLGNSFRITATSSIGSKIITLVADIPSTTFNNTITLGSGTTGDYSVSGMGGVGETQGNAGTVVNSYLTIIDHTDTTKNYKASNSDAQATGTTGTSNGTAVVYYRNGSSLNATANNLRSAIVSSNGHGNSKFSISTNNPLTLTSKGSGTAGNSSGGDTAISDTGLADADLTYTQFTGGVNEVRTNSFYTITDNTASGSITKKYSISAVSDAVKATGTTGQALNGQAVVYFNKGSSNNITMLNLELAIEHANGHNGSITVSRSNAVLTLTQATVGISGNDSSTTGGLSNISQTLAGFSHTNFSGGASATTTTPDKYLQITNATGLVRRYHAATTEAQNSTATIGGVVYVYFTNHATPATLATNLKTAIENTNGHNGSISVSISGAVLTLSIAVNNNQAISETFSNNLEISSAGTISSGVYPWNTSNNLIINVASGQADTIGVGTKIYNSSVNLIGTVSAISGTAITLASAPAVTVTSTLYVNQPKEALYLESMFKISFVYYKTGIVELHINNAKLLRVDSQILNFILNPSDCKIGRGENNQEQFYGELYEIGYYSGAKPSVATDITTLTPNYKNILFYYRFGDE